MTNVTMKRKQHTPEQPITMLRKTYTSRANRNKDWLAQLVCGLVGAVAITTVTSAQIENCGPDGTGVNAENRTDGYGVAVAGTGDIDGDGYDDFLVSDGMYTDIEYHQGAVHLFRGSDYSIMMTIVGTSENDSFGFAADGAGDVDGDGVPDIVVGAPGKGENLNGAVYVISGANFSFIGGGSIVGGDDGDMLGTAVAGIGDVTGDGVDDIMFSAPYAFANGQHDAGIVYVYTYESGLWEPVTTFNGSASEDNLGGSLAYAGDVNGDGYGDVVMSLKDHFRVWASSSVKGIWTQLPDYQIGSHHPFVAGVGDVNRDGLDDIGFTRPNNQVGVASYTEDSLGQWTFELIGGMDGNNIDGRLNFDGTCHASIMVVDVVGDLALETVLIYTYDSGTNSFSYDPVSQTTCDWIGGGGGNLRINLGQDIANVGNINDNQVFDIIYSYEPDPPNNPPDEACVFTCLPDIGDTWCMDLLVSPVLAGQTAEFQVQYGQANTVTYLLYALSMGTTYLQSLDVTVDLNNPSQVGSAKTTNGDGKTWWIQHIPQAASGRTLYFQAVQYGRKSRLVRRDVP